MNALNEQAHATARRVIADDPSAADTIGGNRPGQAAYPNKVLSECTLGVAHSRETGPQAWGAPWDAAWP